MNCYLLSTHMHIPITARMHTHTHTHTHTTRLKGIPTFTAHLKLYKTNRWSTFSVVLSLSKAIISIMGK